jgi:hypothetical protein
VFIRKQGGAQSNAANGTIALLVTPMMRNVNGSFFGEKYWQSFRKGGF